MRVLLLLLLVMACAPAQTQVQHSVRVECLVLQKALQDLFAIETNVELDQRPETCMTSSLVQMFRRESLAQLPGQGSDATGLTVVLRDGDAQFSELLVLALIGRHYTAHFKDSQTHFVFNTATQTLTPRLPKCEYQKSFFIMLLFVSIALLVFSMVLQRLNRIEKDSGPAPPASMSTSAPSHVSIDFNTRRLPGSRGGYSLLAP